MVVAWQLEIIGINLILFACLYPKVKVVRVLDLYTVLIIVHLIKEIYWYFKNRNKNRNKKPVEGIDSPDWYNKILWYFRNEGREKTPDYDHPEFLSPMFRFLMLFTLLVYIIRVKDRPLILWMLLLNTGLYYINSFVPDEHQQKIILLALQFFFLVLYRYKLISI